MMPDVEVGQVWRHKKRGGLYTVIGMADLQCSAAPEFEKMFEDDQFVIYQGEHLNLYIRPLPEFADGRFALVRDRDKG